MSLPIIYRSEIDSPLRCDQYDANLRASLDRGNHFGTQLASTISDLKTTVEAYDFITALKNCCTTLTNQLTQLQEDLFGEGELSTIINTLRNELLQDISELQADLTALEGRVTTAENTITSFSSSIATLATAVTGLTNSKANINSPTFTGIPKAPTPISGADSTQIATVGYVTNFSLPIGVILQYGGGTVPNDSFAFAVGQAISRTTYAGLFAIFGITYGVGDGANTFNLPNLQQRVPVGTGTGYTLGQTGGETAHTLSESEIASHGHNASAAPHTHSLNDPGHTHTYTDSGEYPGNYAWDYGDNYSIITISKNTSASVTGTTISAASISLNVNPTGGGQPHNNMQPYIVLNYIVKIK